MKNPWMSMWLSAANKAAGTGRGLWMAEAKRRQGALVKEMARASGFETGTSGQRAASKRRAKG